MTSASSFPGPAVPLRWHAMSAGEREIEYSPSSCLPDGDYQPFVDAYATISDQVWSDLEAAPDVRTTVVRYGDAPMRTIDVAVPSTTGPDAPLLAFVHGGYWQELSKVESRFAAHDCVRRGWAFAAIDYPLAPHADLATIVDSCRRAVRTLHENGRSLEFDPNRIVVSGSSAGAHLAAMVALDTAAPPQHVAGTVLVSGVYELEPLIGTSIDGALGLDRATAGLNSPLRADLTGFPPTVVGYGSDETAEFKAQSQAFAAALGRDEARVTGVEVAGRNHFDVILDLAAPSTTLGDAVAALIDTTGGPDAHL